jgi:hypothetical protein
MKRTLFVLALGAVVLAGCSHPRHRLPDPTRPQVFVAEGDYLVLNQEPIVIVRKPGEPAKITWRLAAGGPVFEPDGIKIIGRVKGPGQSPDRPDPSQNELFKCSGSENRLEFTCLIAPTVKEGQYAYAVNANRGGKRIVLDPTIMIR